MTAPVIKGPLSPLECVKIGNFARSMSFPEKLLSCQEALSTSTVATPFEGSSTFAIVSATCDGSQPRAIAALSWDATPLQNTGHGLPVTFSKRHAPLPSRARLAPTSANSYSIETGLLILASWPCESRADMKSRKSFISVTTRS